MQSNDKIELAGKLKMQLTNCIGWDGDELAKARKDAFDYYFQRPRGDEIVGRSEIVSGDLSSMVEGNLAQMAEPLSNRRIAEFCAYDQLDEEQAQLESECVHEMLFKRQNGFIEVLAGIKDCMLLRNGIVKVWIDERKHSKHVRKENVNPEVVQELLEKIKQTNRNTRGVESEVEIHKYDPEAKKVSFTVHKTTRKFTVQAIDPNNFLVPKDWDRYDLEGIPFCAERHVEQRSALIERGFDKALVDELPRTQQKQNVTSQGKLPNQMSPNNVAVDKAHELVEWFECYVLLDDGGGASELRCVSVGLTGGSNIVLDDTDVDLVSYACGAIIINPHTFIGISLYDKLKSTQDSTTALTRALMDNLNATTKNRTAHLNGVVEETDITDGRTNGSIRVNPTMGVMDVRQAITAFGIPDTSANILANLDSMRRTRSEMGGATLDMATGQMQLNDRLGSQGLDRAYSVMEQFAQFMTKTVANTLVRSMYLIAHEVLRTGWMGPISFKRGKDWLMQDPTKWQVREAVNVNLGSSLGERARQGAILEKVMAEQKALAGVGMEEILVDVLGYYTATMEWLRVNDIANPERFFRDPRTKEAQQAFAARAQQRAQQQQKQDGLLQQAIGLEQLRVALDKYKQDSDLQFKYYDSVLGVQVEEAKLVSGAVVDINKAKLQATAAKEKGDDKARSNGSGPSVENKPAARSDTD